jgi:ureidoglycolate lyase
MMERICLAQAATPANISAYGTLLEPTADGIAFGASDARLHLAAGVPRFYLMTLEKRPMVVTRITRHLAVTQCLAALNGKSWYILLAPPDEPDNAAALPDVSRLQAFCISGSQALALHRSTWHAGPYFLEDSVDFVNLELSDTNLVDHHTVRLDEQYSTIIHIQTNTPKETSH